MKKPLLILVDDDRAVLAALEASLASAVENVCRIETFTDPRAVLEAVPGWTAERRRIALIVTDQKMPGMTGVEMLMQLRAAGAAPVGASRERPEFDPVRHARTLLITGYAELEVAVAAKNFVGLDHYAQKPWHVPELISATRGLLARHFIETADGAYLDIREADSLQDIRTLLIHRWRALRLGALGVHNGAAPPRAEFDAWDLRARHLGVWIEGSGNSVPIASLRIFGREQARFAEYVRAGEVPGVDASAAGDTPPAPLPVLAFHPAAERVRTYLRFAAPSTAQIVEASAPTIGLELRDAGAVRQMVSAATAFGWGVVQADHVLAFTHPPLIEFFEDAGFQKVAGTDAKSGDRTWSCLAAKAIDKGQGTLAFLEMRFAVAGHACYCSSYPACLPGPYVTGDFRDCDLLCPREAAAMAIT